MTWKQILAGIRTCVFFWAQSVQCGGLEWISVRYLPERTVTAGGDAERARTLHKLAHEKCFIANSVNFPVGCQAEIVVAD
jgi:organic hydroperoxide reductase OsmC/OhrA